MSAASDSPARRDAPRLRALTPADRAPIEAILRATGVFHEAEIAIALELVDAPASAGYRFLVADSEGRVAGYACFGATPLCDGTWDLYWIAVDPRLHGHGIGRALMEACETAIREEDGRLLLIETASKPAYDATRAFYLAWGCREVARVPDFYADGDDKVIYARTLRTTNR
jgi:D-alanine-D-alanine ligase